MTEHNIIKITTASAVTTVSFNVTSLTAEHGLEQAGQQLLDLIENQKPKNLVIDFAGVKFFSSQMLGILINAKKKLSAQEGNVIISGINPQLYRVFKITNLNKIFTFYPNAQAAIDDLKKTKKT